MVLPHDTEEPKFLHSSLHFTSGETEAPLWQLTPPTHTHIVFEAQEIILRLYHDQYELLGLSNLNTHSRMLGLLAGDVSWVCMRWNPIEGSVDGGGC